MAGGLWSVFRWMKPEFTSPLLIFRWPDLDYFSVVDNLMWSLITAFESVALLSMLCFFFLFCGCTV